MTRVWIAVLAGILAGGCDHRKKKPKTPGAALHAAWQGDATVAIDNGADVSLLVAVGTEPPPHDDAIEMPLEPAETLIVELDDDELLWRLEDDAWVELAVETD